MFQCFRDPFDKAGVPFASALDFDGTGPCSDVTKLDPEEVTGEERSNLVSPFDRCHPFCFHVFLKTQSLGFSLRFQPVESRW